MQAASKRRRFQRVTVPQTALIRCWGDSFRGRIRILSEGGAFVDTIHPSPPGAEFKMTIETTSPIQARCVSRMIDPGWGMGVEFVGLENSERTQLRELVSQFL